MPDWDVGELVAQRNLLATRVTATERLLWSLRSQLRSVERQAYGTADRAGLQLGVDPDNPNQWMVVSPE